MFFLCVSFAFCICCKKISDQIQAHMYVDAYVTDKQLSVLYDLYSDCQYHVSFDCVCVIIDKLSSYTNVR